MEKYIHPDQALDIIGDIHGHATELEALLLELGYNEGADCFRHPNGRLVVFLGDYIDRGPEIRRTLEIVRGMIDAGEAYGILGNHELNALRYHHVGPHGEPLRENAGAKKAQHDATLKQLVEVDSEEWLDYLKWFSTLPVALDFGSIRFVHACWDSEQVDILQSLGSLDGVRLETCSDPDHVSFDALETLLSGPEAKLPAGEGFRTADGCYRDEIRISWWLDLEGKTNRDIVFPPDDSISASPIHQIPTLPLFSIDAPLTFFGHYAVKECVPQALLPNLVCLDYGMAKGGQLVAYSWDGEAQIDSSKFTSITQRKDER